jgi:hypothetical protein
VDPSGVQRKWLLSSEPWEMLNVFSLPEIKCSVQLGVDVSVFFDLSLNGLSLTTERRS